MASKSGFLMLIALFAAITFTSCSGGDTGPAIGTPEWFWEAAVERSAAGDFEKVQEHLGKMTDSDNPWRDRAVVWRFVVLNGLAKGYLRLADVYQEGAESKENPPPAFHNLVQQYRRDARRHTINLVDTMQKLRGMLQKQETIAFDFPLPAGTANESPILSGVSTGVVPNDSQVADAEKQSLQRGILLSAAKFAGFGDNVSRVRTALQTPPVEVPAETVQLVLADALVDRSVVFDQEHLFERDKQDFLVNRAKDIIKPFLESENEELKEQAESIQEKIEKQKESDKA